ncbi:MAG: diadenylate cyclase CdaA, partial [Elusimicrobiota bacterium]|nr:diadenylate cyclase CdaA [Elusimicrobiota bacterium]
YRLILLIKGTRALQILVGILILAVVTIFFREIIYLKTLSWLLENFWLAAAIILAIAFQPELRQALAKLGEEPLKRIFISRSLEFIGEIVQAVVEMSQKHIGALVVIEQEARLKNFIETGTIVNGQISKELLLSIFYPNSALHDGAVIVEGSRLIAAGCILPVSENPQISKVLGTRHRAAIGITEVSDAIAVVVSEESSEISLAYEGKLQQNISRDELKKKLIEIYRSRIEKSFISKADEKNLSKT